MGMASSLSTIIELYQRESCIQLDHTAY